jgi:hypothetical protein
MKHAVLVLATLLATGQRAHACDDFAPIAKPMGVALGLGMAGGYLYGTGYYASHDLANDRTGNDYLAGDLAFNGLAATLWGAGTIAELEDGSGYALPLAGMTALHGAMVVHSIENLHLDLHNFNGTAAIWTAGSVYALQVLLFTEGAGERHGRGWSVAEAAINAPLAVGAAYAAYRVDNPGEKLVFTGAAAVSGALALHGIKTAAFPTPVGSDGIGLGTAGTF